MCPEQNTARLNGIQSPREACRNLNPWAPAKADLVLCIQKLALASIEGQAQPLIFRHRFLKNAQYQGVIQNLSSEVTAVYSP
jgi:hypothetical protein